VRRRIGWGVKSEGRIKAARINYYYYWLLVEFELSFGLGGWMVEKEARWSVLSAEDNNNEHLVIII